MPGRELAPALGWTVLALVFLDEVLAVVALGYAWGLLVAVVGVALWWVFASPKAPFGNVATRPVVKVLVFGSACVGLWLAGHPVLALALLVFSVAVNALALLPGVRGLVAQQAR